MLIDLKKLQEWCYDNAIIITDKNYDEVVKKFLNKETVFSYKVDMALEEILKFIKYDEFVLCGSASLKFFGLIDRDINDVDIITFKNLEYREFPSSIKILQNFGGSGSFIVNGESVTCLNASITGLDMAFNLFYKKSKTKYITIKFKEKFLNIELPFGAIDAKIGYFDNDLENSQKHLKDLKNIESLLIDNVTKINNITSTHKRSILLPVDDNDIPF